VNDGYAPSYPRPRTSSNKVVAHRCGSAPNLSRQYRSNGPNRSGPAGFRFPGSRCPARYARTVFLSRPRCRAIADTDHPLSRSACASTDSPCVSIDDELPPSYRTVTPGSIGGSRPGPKDPGGVSPKVGKFSEQVRGISSERQQRYGPDATALRYRPVENLASRAMPRAEVKDGSQPLSIRMLDHARVGTRLHYQARKPGHRDHLPLRPGRQALMGAPWRPHRSKPHVGDRSIPDGWKQAGLAHCEQNGHPPPSADDVGVNIVLAALQKRNSFEEPTVIDSTKCLRKTAPGLGLYPLGKPADG
jgi:hypothetical protein